MLSLKFPEPLEMDTQIMNHLTNNQSVSAENIVESPL